MDLPTCPACGQSVLDDEAKDCPFCGASMSGKPQARQPAAQAASAKSSEPARSAQAEPTRAAASSVKTVGDAAKEDPFAFDSSAKTNAIPLRPEPAKGRAHQVVCPMCETPGYTATKAGGRDVRCCNPECLVPIFTAPEVKRAEPSAEPTKRRPPKVAIAAAGLLVALIASSVWYFGFRDSGESTVGGTVYVPKKGGKDQPVVDDGTKPISDNGNPPPSSHADDPETPRELRAASLEAMNKACLQRENNRSKPYCRRLTANALARIGDVAGTQRQLEQMRTLRPSIPYYRIDPLVALAWRAHQAGDHDAVKQALDRAVVAAAQLPTRGRSRLLYAAELAAALVAGNRLGEARVLIGKHESRTLEGQFAAKLSAMRATKQFNADARVGAAPIYRWAAPQTVAVVIALVARGEMDAARTWADSQQNVEVRSEAAIVWADHSIRRALAEASSIDMATIEAAADGLPPSGRARLYARLAGRRLQAGNKADADALLARAHAELEKTAPPSELVLPGMSELVKLQLPDSTPYRMQAVAAAELALVESRAGNVAKSVAACTLAMRFLRGSAPSPAAIGQRLNEIDDQGDRVIRKQLKRALELKSDDEARLAFNRYRTKCNKLAEAARGRFAVQEAILLAAVEAGLLESVWQEMSARNDQSDPNLREPWASTRVPWRLLDRYEASGNADAAKPVRALLGAAGARRLLIDNIVLAAEELIDGGEFKRAMQTFKGQDDTRVSDVQRDNWRLRLAGRMIAAKKLDAAFEFVGAIDDADAAFRDTALWFAAAQATQLGQARQVWEIGQKESWSATEIVSIYGGLIEALDVSPPPKTAHTEQATLVPTVTTGTRRSAGS